MALLWSAGILWLAYDVAGSAPQAPAAGDNAAQPSDAAAAAGDEARVRELLQNL